MTHLKNQDDLILQLQGYWESEDKKVSFEIIGTGLINIKGIVDQLSDTPLKKSWFSLYRDESIAGWRISNSPVLNACKLPIIAEDRQSFRLTDGIPPVVKGKYNRVFTIENSQEDNQ